MKSLTQEKRYDMIDAFNSTSRYLDDLLNIANIHFEHKYMINGMILILILLIFHSLMAMSLDVPLWGIYISTYSLCRSIFACY